MKSRLLSSQFLFCLLIMSFSSFAKTSVSIRYKTGLNPKKYQTDSKEVFLELGDTVKSIIVNDSGNYKIYLQTETSVTIMNEGPHQDLTDWKHGKSKLVELKKEKNEFLFIDLSKEIDFPKVSLDELVDEVRRLGGDSWAEVAKKCKTPQDYPCGVSPSKHIFKVKKEVEGKWVDQGNLVLIPPMGC